MRCELEEIDFEGLGDWEVDVEEEDELEVDFIFIQGWLRICSMDGLCCGLKDSIHLMSD